MIKYVGLSIFMGFGLLLLASNLAWIGIVVLLSCATGMMAFDRRSKNVKTPVLPVRKQITVQKCAYCGLTYKNLTGRFTKCAACGAPM